MSDKNEDKQTYRLEDVEVDTIGLVKRGANRRYFFLTKSSQTEDGNMAEQTDVQTNPAVEIDDERVRELAKETVAKETEGLVANFFKGLFGGNNDADDDPDDDAVVTVEVPEEIQKKLDTIDDLMKSHQKLAEELDATKKQLEESNLDAETKSFLAKADQFESVGADRREIADFMVFLNKADKEKLEWFENFVKGIDVQLAEAGIFAEFGKDQSPDQDDDPIEALIKSGKAETYRDAYLMLGKDRAAAEKMIADRRKELKTG